MYEFFLLFHYLTNFRFFCGCVVFYLTFLKLIGKLPLGFWHLYKLLCCLNCPTFIMYNPPSCLLCNSPTIQKLKIKVVT